MADNIIAPATGAVLATDDVGGVHYPRTKMSFGADGVAKDVSSADPLPVALPTDAASATKQDGIIAALGETLAVAAETLPLPAGAATSAKQDQMITPLDAMISTAAPFDITPHATNALERPIKAVSITVAGTIVFRHPDEGTDRTVTLPAGLFPLRATHIRATSTATGLTGF